MALIESPYLVLMSFFKVRWVTHGTTDGPILSTKRHISSFPSVFVCVCRFVLKWNIMHRECRRGWIITRSRLLPVSLKARSLEGTKAESPLMHSTHLDTALSIQGMWLVMRSAHRWIVWRIMPGWIIVIHAIPRQWAHVSSRLKPGRHYGMCKMRSPDIHFTCYMLHVAMPIIHNYSIEIEKEGHVAWLEPDRSTVYSL